jgi:hypothetical protein
MPFFNFFSAVAAGRRRLGIPEEWDQVQYWIDCAGSAPLPVPLEDTPRHKKCPEVPTLDSYSFPATPDFWAQFPSHPLPTGPETPINVENLRSLNQQFGGNFTRAQKHRSSVLLYELEHGVSVPFSHQLPGITVPNSMSVAEHGEQFTDVLAHWLKKGFVSGPFILPPYENFRTNQMLAIDQHNKIRIVMNLSGPEGESFNDAIIENSLEKVHMATAKSFGYSVIECGSGARMWKYDMDNAYKNLPAEPSNFRLQGFAWLGRLFLETRQAFGAKSAVAAFDRLGRVIADLAMAASGMPPAWVHRTLDDLPVVTPANSEYGPKFAAAYKDICQQLGVLLATNCPEQVKAFEDSIVGTVLGIRFHTADLSWSISPAKYNKILMHLSGPLLGEPVNLLQMQKIMGFLNDFGQMCQFAMGYKFHLAKFLAHLTVNPDLTAPVPALARADLQIWIRMVESAAGRLPIPHRPVPPALSALTFVSDAAGAKFAKIDGRFVPYGDGGDRGGASISAIEDGPIWFHASVTWPENLLLHARDSQDHAYGCKSPTLEAVAMILPFLCCPQYLLGREVRLLTDNEPVVFGWEAKRLPNDESASIIVRSLHIISHFLGAIVTVQHLPRMSTESAILADKLSRAATTGPEERRAVREAIPYKVPDALLQWLQQPSEDWELPNNLLKEVQQSINHASIQLP